MAYGDKTKATSVEAWLEAHSPGYQYHWVLLLLGATFIVMAAGPPDAWTRVLTVFLQGLTLMAALLASRVSRRLFRLAAVVALGSLLAALGSVVISGSGQPTSVFFLLSILLVATVPWVIARALWQRQMIDVQTVLGAICIYVLLGMMFAFVYAAINGLGNEDFFVQTQSRDDARLPVLQLHHPDHRRVRRLHRRLATSGAPCAVLEALTGQLYLVTIIAVLVSRLSGRNVATPPPVDASTEANETAS